MSLNEGEIEIPKGACALIITRCPSTTSILDSIDVEREKHSERKLYLI